MDFPIQKLCRRSSPCPRSLRANGVGVAWGGVVGIFEDADDEGAAFSTRWCHHLDDSWIHPMTKWTTGTGWDSESGEGIRIPVCIFIIVVGGHVMILNFHARTGYVYIPMGNVYHIFSCIQYIEVPIHRYVPPRTNFSGIMSGPT